MSTTVTSTISDIQSAGEAAKNAEVEANNGNTLDKNAFLKLLTEQMSNQDPTAPMDNTAFVAQLAQFSSLEAMNNVNDTLTAILSSQNSQLQSNAINMVGKTAVFESNEATLIPGSTVKVSADVSSTASNVTMQVADSTGTIVRTVQLGAASQGTNTFEWDGKNNDGDDLPGGTYTITLTAQDFNDQSVSLTQFANERVTGISFNGSGEAIIHAGGQDVSLSKVSQISE